MSGKKFAYSKSAPLWTVDNPFCWLYSRPATIGFWFPPTFASLALFCHVHRYHFWLAIFLVHEKNLDRRVYWFTILIYHFFSSNKKFYAYKKVSSDIKTTRNWTLPPVIHEKDNMSSHINMVDYPVSRKSDFGYFVLLEFKVATWCGGSALTWGIHTELEFPAILV